MRDLPQKVLPERKGGSCETHWRKYWCSMARTSRTNSGKEIQRDLLSGDSVLSHIGLKRSFNSLRFPVVAAESNDSCTCLRKDFLEKEIGGPFAFSEVVSEELDLLQATQDGLIDPVLQVRLLAEIEEGVHHFILISPPCSTI